VADPRVNYRITATDQVSRTLGQIDSRLGRLSGSFKKFASIGATAIGGVAVIRGLQQVTAAALRWGDQLDDLSKRTGVSSRTLQEFQYVAEQSGTSLDALTNAMTRLARANDDAINGSKQVAEAFQRLGIDAAQLASLPLDRRLEVVADALADVANIGERTALATRILGRGAAELLPLFANGAEGIRRFRNEVESTGTVLTDQQIRALGDANDAWAKFTTTVANLGRLLVAEVAPALTDIANDLTSRVGPATNAIVTEFDALTDHLSRLQKVLTVNIGLPDWLTALPSIGWQALKDGIGGVSDALVILAGVFATVAQVAGTFITRQKPLTAGFEEEKAVIDRYIQSVRDLLGIDKQLAKGPPTRGRIRGTKVVAEPPIVDKGAAEKAAKALTAEISKVIEANETPLESYRRQVERIQQLLKSGLSTEQATRELRRLGEELGKQTQAWVDATDAGRRWRQDLDDIASISEEAQTPLERLEEQMARLARLRPPTIRAVGTGEQGAAAASYHQAGVDIRQAIRELNALPVPVLPAVAADPEGEIALARYKQATDGAVAEFRRIERLNPPVLPAIEIEAGNTEVVREYGNLVGRAVAGAAADLQKIDDLPAPRLPDIIVPPIGDVTAPYELAAEQVAEQIERINDIPAGYLPDIIFDRSQLKALDEYGEAIDLTTERYDKLAVTLGRLAELEKAGVLDSDIAATARRKAFDEMTRSADQTNDAFEQLARRYADLEKRFQGGRITGEVMERAKLDAWDDYLEKARTVSEETQGLTNSLLSSIRDAVDGYAREITDIFFDTTKSIGDMFRDLLEQIARMMVQRTIVEPFLNAITAGIGTLGGGLKEIDMSKLPKRRAMGGPVFGGEPYLVGEQGPELFMPRSGGTIIPNAGAAGTLAITFNVNSLDPRTAAAVIADNEKVITNVIRRAQVKAGFRPTL
jgi:hypothetical protein